MRAGMGTQTGPGGWGGLEGGWADACGWAGPRRGRTSQRRARPASFPLAGPREIDLESKSKVTQLKRERAN